MKRNNIIACVTMTGALVLTCSILFSVASLGIAPHADDINYSLTMDETNKCANLNYDTYQSGNSQFKYVVLEYDNAKLADNYHVLLTRGGNIRNSLSGVPITNLTSICVTFTQDSATPYGNLKLKTSSSYIDDPELGGSILNSGVPVSFSSPGSDAAYFSIYSATSDYKISSIEITYKCGSYIAPTKVNQSIDLYTVNDFHGKVEYMSSYYPGASKLTAYFNDNIASNYDNSLILSDGDMFQGYADSNITKGDIVIQYMNNVGFSAMAVGNHEFDWGQAALQENAERSNFPYLGINIYNTITNERVSWASSSRLISKNGVKIGIIGAASAFSSISSVVTQNLEFKSSDALYTLVKNESDNLHRQGADFIIYMVHNGGTGSDIYSGVDYYSTSFADYSSNYPTQKYVDIVVEGHTHTDYDVIDSVGLHHIQSSGDGASARKTTIDFVYNSSTDSYSYNISNLETSNLSTLSSLDNETVFGTSTTNNSIYKYYYDSQIALVKNVVQTTNSPGYSSAQVGQICADQLYAHYYNMATELGYNILLAGGQFKLRSPYKLSSGTINYGNVLTILPFDNAIGIASVSGSKINSIFFGSSSSSNYYYSYPTSVSVDTSQTYYIITDSWTYAYSYNKMTLVHDFADQLYARDMVCEYLRAL